MSKPIVRITVFVLVSLVLIAATSVGMRSWLGSTHQTTGVHAVSGLYTDFNHQRSTVTELESYQLQNEANSSHQGGCQSEGQTSPID